MASSSIFISAADARQNPMRETTIHAEARGIEAAILDAVKNGLFQATVSDGTPLTSNGAINVPVSNIDAITDQLYIPSHPFSNGDLVTVNSMGTLPPPLDSTKFYAVIYIDTNNIKLAASAADVNNRRPISIDFTAGVTTITLDPEMDSSGYLSAPNITIDPPANGTTATAYAILSNAGIIDDISLINSGSGFNDVPTVDIASQGNGAVVAVVGFNVVDVSIAEGGSNYRVGDVLEIIGGVGIPTVLTVTAIDNGFNGRVRGVSLSRSGNYEVLPPLNSADTIVYPTGGIGCQLNIIMGIAGIALMSGGADYVSPPIVTISGGNGDGATAEAVVETGRVVRIDLINSGSGYTAQPTVTVDSGSGATASAVLTPTRINSIQIINSNIGYVAPPPVSIEAVGSGAEAQVSSMLIKTATISNAGGGYTVGDVLLISGGSGDEDASIQVTKVGNLGEITAYSLVTTGSYSFLPALRANPVVGGTGQSASFNLVAGIKSITMIHSGSGYTTPPALIITPTDGNGSGAKAYTTLNSTSVNDAILTDSGSGYTAVPTVEVTSGSGAQATATTDGTGRITSISLTNAGKNYTCIPNVKVDGTDNIAIATLVSTGMDRIMINSRGANFVSKPNLFLSGGAAQEGDFVSPNTSVRLSYSIDSIVVTNPGSGYESAPYVTIPMHNGTWGTDAYAMSTLGIGNSTLIVSLYPDGIDYWKVWKNLTPSNTLYTRPYAERMDTVIAYFTNLGYTINRQTNPATGKTIQWQVMW